MKWEEIGSAAVRWTIPRWALFLGAVGIALLWFAALGLHATLLKALIAFVPITALGVYAAMAFNRHRAAWSALLLAGAVSLIVVVLTHVAEALHLFPAMGWGEPHSVGHYLDQASAVGGIALLSAAVAFRLLRHER